MPPPLIPPPHNITISLSIIMPRFYSKAACGERGRRGEGRKGEGATDLFGYEQSYVHTLEGNSKVNSSNIIFKEEK